MSEYRYQYQVFERRAVSGVFPAAAGKAEIAVQKPFVLMVGMHLTKTRGGITTLTTAILNSGLKHDFDFLYLASQAEEFGRIRKLLLAVTAALQFIVICLCKQPALVYIHVGSNASLYRESAFILLAKLMRKRVLSHFHAGDIENYYPKQSRLGKMFIRRAIGLSDSVIAVSQESVPQLRNLNPSLKISVLQNAIDTSAFNNVLDRSRQRRPGEPVKLLFVGAVGKLKGEKDLIKALVILRDRKLNVKATFLGYGAENLAAYCEKLGVTDLIDHLGHVSIQERLNFFLKSDIFVLPTYAEAMPISVIEAMAAGLAIVSTPIGGIPEMVEDGREALLVPSGNVDALAEAISFLVNNKKERLEMGRKAKQKAREQMDFATYVDRLRTEIIRVSQPENKL